MLEVEKWANNKRFMIALFAPLVAKSAQDIHRAFEQLREWKFLDQKLPAVDRDAWYRLYRSHKKTYEVLKIIIELRFNKKVAEKGYAALRLLFSHRTVRKHMPSVKITPQRITVFQKMLDGMLSLLFKVLKIELSDAPTDPVIKDKILCHFRNNPDFTFFVLITTPCWILYKISPAHLYRKARCGDLDALDKILRLDPLMIHEHYISKRMTELHFSNKTLAYENLLSAAHKYPNVIISQKKMKVSIAGLISALSLLFGPQLTSSEIRKLFDAVAKDSVPEDQKLETIDEDIPDGEDAFRRAIERERKIWIGMFNPDKRKFSGVRVQQAVT